MRSALPLLLAFAFVCTPAAAIDDYPRDWDVDVQHYRFHLTLSDASNEIVGSTEITVHFAQAGVREVTLELVGRAAGAATGMEVVAVTSEDRPVRHSHAADRLTLSLPEPAALAL